MAFSEEKSLQTLRIIDANLNRIGEGLRLLEEIARLLLNDTAITQQLKTMRHELLRSDSLYQQQLLQSRDSEGDVGINMGITGENKERELPLVVVANSRRVQESLRVLEELARVPGTVLKQDTDSYKQARFNLYTIERQLISRMLRQDKKGIVSGLYVIIDTQMLKGRSHLEVADQAIRGGAKMIQLRDKIQSKKKVLPVAEQLKTLCNEHNVLFIVNDYLDVALATNADGLHLGQDDLPINVARKLMLLDKIIGCSTTTVEQAVQAQSEGADYIAVGAIYQTLSKTSTTTPARVVGLDTLRQVRQAVNLPIVAIGGITKDNAPEVVAAGADAVAVISAVLGAESPETAVRQIVASIKAKN
jgi:thiamine-phosphate pyrophosphorylase